MIRGNSRLFVSYNRRDRHLVDRVCACLDRCEVPYWIDRQGIRASDEWYRNIIEALYRSQTALIIVGRHGIGPVQEDEVLACLRRAAEKQLHVIPVLLPHVVSTGPVMESLLRFHAVDFRDGFTPVSKTELIRAVLPLGSLQQHEVEDSKSEEGSPLVFIAALSGTAPKILGLACVCGSRSLVTGESTRQSVQASLEAGVVVVACDSKSRQHRVYYASRKRIDHRHSFGELTTSKHHLRSFKQQPVVGKLSTTLELVFPRCGVAAAFLDWQNDFLSARICVRSVSSQVAVVESMPRQLGLDGVPVFSPQSRRQVGILSHFGGNFFVVSANVTFPY